MIMGEQQYIATGLPHSGGLSGHPDLADFSQDSTSQAPSYQELTPYSTVSTFTLPSQCDSSLLTPISSAASPPLHDVHQAARRYSVAPGTPQSQECASPSDQKMYHTWANHLELNAHNSGTNSPMATQASVSSEYLESYVSDGRRTPAPPPTYLGNFAVSDPSDSHPLQQPDSPYYPLGMTQLDHHGSLPMRDSQSMAMEAAHRGVARSMAHIPTITAPPTMNSSPSPHLRHESRDSQDETVFLHYPNESMHRGPSGSPGRRILQGTGRVKKSRPSRRQNRNGNRTLDPSAEHKNCFGQEVPPTLKPDTPAQERCIWDARWKHRYSKGQNMWDNIWSEYNKTFEGQKVPKGRGARENLQMKFKRSRCKYLEWLPKDDEILNEAWHIMERERYRNLLNLFLELGGSRNMCLGVEDIEVRVVHNLKLEENLYMEAHGDLGVRRRRRTKAAPKKRSDDDYAQADIEMSAVPGATVGSSEHDAVMEQVFDCREIKDEEDLSEDDMMDVNAWNRQAETKVDSRAYLERRVS